MANAVLPPLTSLPTLSFSATDFYSDDTTNATAFANEDLETATGKNYGDQFNSLAGNDGFLTADETNNWVTDALSQYGITLTPEQKTALQGKIDTAASDGKVTSDEASAIFADVEATVGKDIFKSIQPGTALGGAATGTPAASAPQDSDGDGVFDLEDGDVDGDGIENAQDTENLDKNGKEITVTDANGTEKPINTIEGKVDKTRATEDDIDGDGIADKFDRDVDGDGTDNTQDTDIDGDGILNEADDDIDGDGATDDIDDDVDGDGKANNQDDDIDGDGQLNGKDDDTDGDGKSNDQDDDIDGDGLKNTDANEADIDGDFIFDALDTDVDGDQKIDATDDTDDDADGILDSEDTDDNGDGKVDTVEATSGGGEGGDQNGDNDPNANGDDDKDGTLNKDDPDYTPPADNTTTTDTTGTLADADGDGIPDEVENLFDEQGIPEEDQKLVYDAIVEAIKANPPEGKPEGWEPTDQEIFKIINQNRDSLKGFSDNVEAKKAYDSATQKDAIDAGFTNIGLHPEDNALLYAAFKTADYTDQEIVDYLNDADKSSRLKQKLADFYAQQDQAA